MPIDDKRDVENTMPAALPDGFVLLRNVAPGILQDLRYAGRGNLTGRVVDGYEGNDCILTLEAAQALHDVTKDLLARGLGLKIFDGYRPQRAVDCLLRWSQAPEDGAKRSAHYPNIDRVNLFRLGYISERSSHSRGSTVDLTLVKLENGRHLEMGTPFDFMDPLSHPDCPDVPKIARGNRALLAGAMRRRGFVGYEREWWHFTLMNEPFPDTFFDFPIRPRS